MKRNINNLTRLSIAALALISLCRTATADINGLTATQTTNAWPTEPNPVIYSSAPLATFAGTTSLSADGPPAAATGALANSLSETFTISNGMGNLGGFAGPGNGTNYVLTGVAILISGYSATVPCTLHLYDVTSNLFSNNGNTLNGSGASYNGLTNLPIGDLLGENQGLPFINAADSGAEHILYISLQNGPNTYGDQVILASNHTYALEVSVPTAAAPGGAGGFFWLKSSTADPGGQGMGSVNSLSPTNNHVTLVTLGQVGGAPRTFAMALYGTPALTNQAPSVNASTNVVSTTNYFVDQFNALSVSPGNPYYTNMSLAAFDYSTNTTGVSQIGSIWKSWFGSAPNITWDNTNDAQGNTNGGLGGSMLLQPVFAAGGQIEVFDSTTGDPFGTGILPNINASLLGITSFEADVMFDASSAVQTNAAGLVYFGNLQFGHDLAGSQAYIGGAVLVPQSQSNQWVHVKIPLNPNDTALAAIPDILIHIYGPFGADPNSPNGGDLIGPTKFWVDNLKFKGPLAPPLTPPPALKIARAVPGAARFFGVAPQYTRTELASFDTSQSWVGSLGDDASGGPFTLPVSYSMSLSHIATSPNVATRIWLVDNDTGNYNGQDFSAASELWLNIAGISNGAAWQGQVAWKAFLTGNNPNHVALTVTNTVGVGTWTLTFTGWTNGNLLAPGWTTASNFTIDVSTVSNTAPPGTAGFGDLGLTAFTEAFANPMKAVFGIEDDNAAAVGAYDDFTRLSVTNVLGINELDVFSLDTAVDTTNMWGGNFNTGAPTGYYQITNALANAGAGFTSAYPATLQTPIILVTTNTPYWLTWNVTTNGYGLAESTNGLLPISSLVSPASLSGYLDMPQQIVAGGTNWALIPRDCLPGTNQSYFRVVNPPPQN